MSIEGLTATLEERGLIWQGSGFASIGVTSLVLLSVYSEADHWSIGIYRLAVTQLNWAFVLAIALAIERVRRMFETRTEIRKAARAEFVAKAIEKAERRGEERGKLEGKQLGEQQAAERYKANLRKQGIEITPEMERTVFENGDHRKWWHRFPPFRSR